jgi:hypothetical protein
MDRVHGARSTSLWRSLSEHHSITDMRPRLSHTNHFPTIWSQAHIKTRMVKAISSTFINAKETEPGSGSMVNGKEGYNSLYTPPNAKRFRPTWSRWREESVLHTYGGRNQAWKAGDGDAVQPTFGDGEWLLRWSSCDKNMLNRLLMFPSYSSMLQFLRRGGELTPHDDLIEV